MSPRSSRRAVSVFCFYSRFALVQVAVVTGGARGLGNEFCRAFVRSGCTELAIVDLKEEEAAESAEALIKEACSAHPPLPPRARAR